MPDPAPSDGLSIRKKPVATVAFVLMFITLRLLDSYTLMLVFSSDVSCRCSWLPEPIGAAIMCREQKASPKQEPRRTVMSPAIFKTNLQIEFLFIFYHFNSMNPSRS
jgi:hypothetical protein